MPTLKDAENRTVLVITQKTLGWKNANTHSGRKERDWISASQFKKYGGISRRALCIAIQSLIDKNLIIVSDEYGNILDAPARRKGKCRLYYQLSPQLMPPCADYAEQIRTKSAALAHKMRTTQ